MKVVLLAVVILLTWKCTLQWLETKERVVIDNVIDKYLYVLDTSGVLFPRVALAQNILETGIFRSNVCKENHNLFGMKESRRKYDIGSRRGHALYPHTKHVGKCTVECYIHSIRDYRDWQREFRVAERCSTEEEYVYYLQHLPGGRKYAEDPRYEEKLNNIIKLF